VSIKLITPVGMLFTTALLAIFCTYAFLIGSIEESWLMLMGSLTAAVAAYGTAMVRPWSRYLVYLITAGFLLKLGSSILSAYQAGYFDFQFESRAAAIRALVPAVAVAVLGLVSCAVVHRQFKGTSRSVSD
jgi:hypothetical protein